MNAPRYMVFDVESVGLHGEGFAVGWVVLDSTGQEIDAACYACDPARAAGDAVGRNWVAVNMPDGRVPYNCPSPAAVRSLFWRAWTVVDSQEAVLVADCGWPVEARFLAACIDDDPVGRPWFSGPYPLHEIGTARLLAGFSPTAPVERLPTELPAHNPLADARQSARLWLEALAVLGKAAP